MKLLATVLALSLAMPVSAQIRREDTQTLEMRNGMVIPVDLLPLRTGEEAPAPGVWVSEAAFIRLAQRTASAEAERDALRANPPVPTLSALGALLLLLGVGVGVGVGWQLHTHLGGR